MPTERGRVSVSFKEKRVLVADDGVGIVKHTIEQSTACQIRIHHPMLRAIRAPRIFHILAEAQVRNGPVHGPQCAVLNHFPNLDAQGEKPRPHRFHQK